MTEAKGEIQISLLFPDLHTSCDIPVFNFVCALNVINVHADLVADIRWEVGAVSLHFWEHDSRPEFPIIQKAHGLVY